MFDKSWFCGLAALSIACGAPAEVPDTETTATALPGPRPGAPFPDLTEEQRQLFIAGGIAFVRDMTPADGVGPVFIERSCVACHALGGVGGADALHNPNHLVQRFGTTNADGSYNNLASLGGDVLQTRSISVAVPSCQVAPEQIPPQATVHAVRNPLPMFGIGLMAAIPDATILAGAVDKGDGVHGRPNLAPNGRPGRFGWKAQTAALEPFNAAAANGTMGMTSRQSPNEQAPQGQPMPAGCDNTSLGATSPNDASGLFIQNLTVWEVLLAPVTPIPIPQHGPAADGRVLFEQIGCAKCHVPSMETGDFSVTLADGRVLPMEPVSNKTAALYSDLLLHDMGPGMDEVVTMRQARGSEFRTAPLWGIRLRKRFLHDGRAHTYEEAIAEHGGSASIIRDRYLALSPPERHAIRAFLDRL